MRIGEIGVEPSNDAVESVISVEVKVEESSEVELGLGDSLQIDV